MNDWIKTLVGYLLIVSVITQMMPNRKYEQYVRLFTGFLLIILILQPVLKIGSANAFLEGKIHAFVQEQEELEAQIGVQSEKFRKKSEEVQWDNQEQIVIEEIQEVQVEVKPDD